MRKLHLDFVGSRKAGGLGAALLLRKLKVQNRAQAVAKGHSLQILNASHPS